MAEIRARVLVGTDHRISGIAPPVVPPGEHQVTIILETLVTRQSPAERFDLSAIPTHDLGPWPENLSLRREDIYDEDGR